MVQDELYSLCREVYEKTGWDDDSLGKNESELARKGLVDEFVLKLPRRIGDGVWESPLYTSDYLLGKLPSYHEYWNSSAEYGYLIVKHWHRDFEAGYWAFDNTDQQDNKFTSGFCATPLKALLKLTLALKEAGQL